MVRISELLKGSLKMHYLVCFGKINTLKLDPGAYSWEGGEPMFSFTTALKKKMLKDFKPNSILWERGG